VSVWADGSWMLDGPCDDLARLLAEPPYELSCDEIARRLHRRRAAVLAELRVDPCYEHVGRGRGSRWRLRSRRGRVRDGQGAAEGRGVDHRPAQAGDAASEAVVIPGQTTVYEMLADAQVSAG
jgi:hypothetical protein